MSDTSSFAAPNNQSTEECLEAIAIATRSLHGEYIKFTDYKLIAAENLFNESSNIWLLTFKLRHLLPKDADSPIGAGGEILARVDVKSKSCSVTYGD